MIRVEALRRMWTSPHPLCYGIGTTLLSPLHCEQQWTIDIICHTSMWHFVVFILRMRWWPHTYSAKIHIQWDIKSKSTLKTDDSKSVLINIKNDQAMLLFCNLSLSIVTPCYSLYKRFPCFHKMFTNIFKSWWFMLYMVLHKPLECIPLKLKINNNKNIKQQYFIT